MVKKLTYDEEVAYEKEGMRRLKKGTIDENYNAMLKASTDLLEDAKNDKLSELDDDGRMNRYYDYLYHYTSPWKRTYGEYAGKEAFESAAYQLQRLDLSPELYKSQVILFAERGIKEFRGHYSDITLMIKYQKQQPGLYPK